MTHVCENRPLYDAPLYESERHERMRADARHMRVEDRFICDTLRLARLCPRAACRRADRCRGRYPRLCLDTRGEAAPPEAHDFAERLADARASGERREDIEAAFPDSALAWRCWAAALAARRRN